MGNNEPSSKVSVTRHHERTTRPHIKHDSSVTRGFPRPTGISCYGRGVRYNRMGILDVFSLLWSPSIFHVHRLHVWNEVW